MHIVGVGDLHIEFPSTSTFNYRHKVLPGVHTTPGVYTIISINNICPSSCLHLNLETLIRYVPSALLFLLMVIACVYYSLIRCPTPQNWSGSASSGASVNLKTSSTFISSKNIEKHCKGPYIKTNATCHIDRGLIIHYNKVKFLHQKVSNIFQPPDPNVPPLLFIPLTKLS